MSTTLDEVVADELVTLDRGQFGRILRYAANNDYGAFDGRLMTRVDERHDAAVAEPDEQPRLF